MVFFTCNHCGESVKKAAVEKHYNTKCRGATENVSCMDCLKDFHGKEYVAHTKCITELQKYSGKDYVHKESKNSGSKKQESWMDIIRAILDSNDYKLSEQARNAFQRLQSVDNVPRKKAKFQNFVKNCMHMPMRLAEDVWNVLEKEQEKMKLAKQQEKAAAAAAAANTQDDPQQNGVKRGVTEETENQEPAKKKSKKIKTQNGKVQEEESVSIESVEPKKKKSKKREICADSAVAAESNGTNGPVKKKSKKQKNNIQEVEITKMVANDTTLEANTKDSDDFEWSAVLNKIVQKNDDGIALEKLKKRVLKKYAAKIGTEELTEKQQKAFEKKFFKNLKKCTAVQVIGEVVKAC